MYDYLISKGYPVAVLDIMSKVDLENEYKAVYSYLNGLDVKTI
ncbi:hypothetical protein [Aquibacillus saliphilus]|nr:hypothetical protein [Aquibacillus saliphilus]